MRRCALAALLLALAALAGCYEPVEESEVAEPNGNDQIDADDTLWLCDPYEEVAECVPAEEVNLP